MDANFTIDRKVQVDTRAVIDRFLDEYFIPIVLGVITVLWTIQAFVSAIGV